MAELAVTPGLEWRAFTAAFPWVPEFTTMSPATRGFAARPSLAVRPRDNDIGLLFIGYLKAPADGDYTFFLSTDTRALLRLHAATVLDADFGYGFEQPSEITGRITLKAGLHPIRLYYVHGTKGTPALDLRWSGPGIAKEPIPAEVFFRAEEFSARRAQK